MTDEQWFDIAKRSDLSSEDGIVTALCSVRLAAKQDFAPVLQKALQKFISLNNQNPPASISELKTFFDSRVDDQILSQYQILREDDRNGWLRDMILVNTNIIDKARETEFAIGANQTGFGPRTSVALKFPKELIPALDAYQRNNPRQVPKDFSQLEPYITTPEQQAALKRLENDLHQ